MTIIARRFTIICLIMSLFAVGLTAAVESSGKRNHVGVIGLSAPCPQPSGIHCKASL
ncbi:hypothetical protein IHQ71_07280 [Rhizobium sp. TH2]|uniref:hypothetical protein n=1 Tax=Rhizobium sp. TH2 TaxID=2775403 RepID=UPI0021571C36|nr:hypothetical protein [Rhizobium sp. TH2]UVC10399.1 hypothetical protein IHQ71_07280 [Rhizobium sp. TH2]